MKTDHIDSRGIICGDYFRFVYVRNCNKTLEDHLKQFNIEDYYIFKSSGRYKQVSIDEFMTFKYAGYMFFKKSLYNLNEFNDWIDYLYELKIAPNYLSKPFPPLYVKNLIKVI